MDINLLVDIFYVNNVPFLITLGKPVEFVTVQALPNERANTIKNNLDKVMNLYKSRGFNITKVDADGQFEFLEG